MKILHTGKDELVIIIKCSFCSSTLMLEETDLIRNPCNCNAIFFETFRYCNIIGGHGFQFTCGSCHQPQIRYAVNDYFVQMEKTFALLLTMQNGIN
jgi:hypothetical protein